MCVCVCVCVCVYFVRVYRDGSTSVEAINNDYLINNYSFNKNKIKFKKYIYILQRTRSGSLIIIFSVWIVSSYWHRWVDNYGKG